KEFIDAKFSCIRYGNKQQSDDAINPRPSPKIGCKASLHVKRRQDGKWYVYSFVKEHNHELLPAQAHFFRSHRNSDPLSNDVRMRRRKNSTAGVDLNEEHRLRNVFWVDSKGLEDFGYFSDVVSFDTTYFTSKYKIPLVLFVGVNHHMQPTLLGCALIADETVFTFAWLLQTWFIAMGERAPQVILTDQNDALKAAVAARTNLKRDGGSWLIGLNLEILSGSNPCMMIEQVGCQLL
ncbi:protein FAR1-RELATED SEQUENCE 4-like, partial [Trifolium medium]|nr:protein FAR1-RELATED SEQUENCE 4-like [Trifolium medium]